MKATVKWLDGAMMVAESGSGHAVVLDGPEAFGGRNLGIRPMEMLLIGMGGCAEFDVIHILKRSRQNIQGCQVEVTGQRAEIEPKVFTQIHAHFRVSGYSLTPKVVERAIKLSAEKYCSASIMLAATAEVTHDYELIELADAC